MTELELTFKILECQKTARKFYKEEYEEKIKWYKKTIMDYKATIKTDNVLFALIDILQLNSVEENGMAQMLFISAAGDLIGEKK